MNLYSYYLTSFNNFNLLLKVFTFILSFFNNGAKIHDNTPLVKINLNYYVYPFKFLRKILKIGKVFSNSDKKYSNTMHKNPVLIDLSKTSSTTKKV